METENKGIGSHILNIVLIFTIVIAARGFIIGLNYTRIQNE